MKFIFKFLDLFWFLICWKVVFFIGNGWNNSYYLGFYIFLRMIFVFGKFLCCYYILLEEEIGCYKIRNK